MNYFYVLMLTALTTPNLSHGMAERKEAQASKQESFGIMPALAKTSDPEFQKVPQSMLKNNIGHDVSLVLLYEMKDKNRIRTVQTFVDAWKSTPIPDYMNTYELIGVQAKLMYAGNTAFEPLELNEVQKAFLNNNKVYISLEEVGNKLAINVRRYREKTEKQKVVKPSAPREQQACVEAKREAAVPLTTSVAPAAHVSS